MVEIGLHGNYWKQLKEYYETEYTPIEMNDSTKKYVEEYATELMIGEASFLDEDMPYHPDSIITWWEDIKYYVEDGMRDEDEMLSEYPNFYEYEVVFDQLAQYFLNQDLERFSVEMENENPEFVEEAQRLDWELMINKIPSIKELFVF